MNNFGIENIVIIVVFAILVMTLPGLWKLFSLVPLLFFHQEIGRGNRR
jgi:hypothetical protein